jgi:opacity protein-like surface antigen
MMDSFRRILLAGAAVIITAPAFAADLPPALYKAPPVVTEDFGSGWYLRGDIGVGMIKSKGFEYVPDPLFLTDFAIEHSALGDTVFVGAGIGYQYSSWLRFDFTAEYRSKADLHAWGSYTIGCPSGVCLDVYDGHLKSWVFLANAYLDLGTWWCLTPFVGAGVGGAYNIIAGLSDFGPQTAGRGTAADHGEWNFAWALHAGIAYNYAPNLKFEVAYRYLNYGDASATINCLGAGCAPASSHYRLKDLESHDFKLGVRWLLNEPQPVPLVRKG